MQAGYLDSGLISYPTKTAFVDQEVKNAHRDYTPLVIPNYKPVEISIMFDLHASPNKIDDRLYLENLLHVAFFRNRTLSRGLRYASIGFPCD